MKKEQQIKAVAKMLANQRANRKGGPSIENVLDILPSHLLEEVMDDATAIVDFYEKIIKNEKAESFNEGCAWESEHNKKLDD